MFDEMIDTVKAALTPGADEATRQKAAAILRSVLGMLEPVGGSVPTPAPPQTAASAAPAFPDLLTVIVERIRPLIPADALAEMPRFNIPLIDFGAASKK